MSSNIYHCLNLEVNIANEYKYCDRKYHKHDAENRNIFDQSSIPLPPK